MRLRPGGLDVFYIDESHDKHVFVVSAVRVPFLRKIDEEWMIVWPDYLDQAKQWRKSVSSELQIPTSKELHGVKLASGRGNFKKGKYSFDRPKACAVYRATLAKATFLPPMSVMSVAATRSHSLYGHERLESAMLALFQRMRTACYHNRTNAMVFFDQGHPEYRTLYRMAQVYLPTGSARGAWSSGSGTKNLPMEMFVKDGNEKNSKFCFFTQLADLTAYAAFLKVKAEVGELEEWQSGVSAGNIYDALPATVVNNRVSTAWPQDGIVRLK